APAARCTPAAWRATAGTVHRPARRPAGAGARPRSARRTTCRTRRTRRPGSPSSGRRSRRRLRLGLGHRLLGEAQGGVGLEQRLRCTLVLTLVFGRDDLGGGIERARLEARSEE